MQHSTQAFLSPIIPFRHSKKVQQTSTTRPCRKRVKRDFPCIMQTADNASGPISIPLAPKISDIWELDFYSRPVIGLDGKKLWELIITDSFGDFVHVEAIPNSMVNSRELRQRIQAVIDDSPVKPRVMRFFRVQMLNMISIALSEIDVQVAPSRKTYALYQVIKDREENVYTAMPGFQKSLKKSASKFQGIQLSNTQPLPDALRCESFAFGNFPLGQLEEFFETADSKDFFGDRCLIDDDLSKDTLIPGMIIFSKRAFPLAAWMSGIELAFVKTTLEKREIVLECGLNTSYMFARISPDLKDDVRAFQAGKEKASGLHFLAVQASSEAEEIDGMWLLMET